MREMKKQRGTSFFHGKQCGALSEVAIVKDDEAQHLAAGLNPFMMKPALGWFTLPKRKRLLLLFAVLFLSILAFLSLRASIDCSDCLRDGGKFSTVLRRPHVLAPEVNPMKNPLGFMSSKLVLLVSHELSLSGGPLLLMELAFLLRTVGAQVFWITYQKPAEENEVSRSLEYKMFNRGVQILSAKSQDAIGTALKADMVVLNTAVTGKWLDTVLKEYFSQVFPKILWWIHEMRGNYFRLDYVKHLPFVAAVMIDSNSTAEYWKNRTHERLGIQMPKTYVVHLGNSKELMEVAENYVTRRILREHIRETLGVQNDDLLFGIINSVSRGKGQDLFLQSFYESLNLIREKNLEVPAMHAVVVGSDMNSQTKFEVELRNFVAKQGIQDRVHFINKTLAVAPYLAAIDVLVQNSQGRGECFGRITIEAMAFQLPVLGTAAGGTTEIVVDGVTGLLHPVGKGGGVKTLARNIVRLATQVETRAAMGREGYRKVKERFTEHHMAGRIASVLKEVLPQVRK